MSICNHILEPGQINSRDTMLVEYYDGSTLQTLFGVYMDRYKGKVDIHGNKIVWDAPNPEKPDTFGYLHSDIFMYDGIDTTVISYDDPDHEDYMPSISYGQATWYCVFKDTHELFFYDGGGGIHRITHNEEDEADPKLDNGRFVWAQGDIFSKGSYTLHLFDSLEDTVLDTSTQPPVYWPVSNGLVAWCKWISGSKYNVKHYDGDKVLNLTDGGVYHGNAVDIHNGWVVWQGWDGNDWEIYMYPSDTLYTPPAIVQNVRDTTLSPTHMLIWNANKESDMQGYNIHRSRMSWEYDATPIATVYCPETTFIDPDSANLEGINYYVVIAFDADNNKSGFSNEVAVSYPDTNVPFAPESLVVVEVDTALSKITLSWKAGEEIDLEQYKIYRSDISGNYTTPLDSVKHPCNTFIDSVPLLYINYYVVTAVDWSENESDTSNEVVVLLRDTIPPSPPESLVVVEIDTALFKVTLSWKAGEETDLEWYKIYRSDTSGLYDTIPLASVSHLCTTFIDLEPMYKNYYVVIAMDSSENESNTSNEVLAKLPLFFTKGKEATAYNNSKNLVIDSLNHLHLVFSSGTFVYYSKSIDSGNTWSMESVGIGKDFSCPAISIDENINVHVTWIDEFAEKYCYRRKTNTGLGEIKYFDYSDPKYKYLYGPSIVATVDTVHMSFLACKIRPICMHAFHLKFSPDYPESTIIDTLEESNMYTGDIYLASIDLDTNGFPHICWGIAVNPSELQIHYKYWNGLNWSNIEIISNTATTGTINPLLQIWNDQTHVAWQGKNNGIYHRQGIIEDTVLWHSTIDTIDTDGKFPVIVGGSQIIFEKGNYIYHANFNGVEWEVPKKLTEEGLSYYPQSVIEYRSGKMSTLHYVFTTGASAPYEVKYSSTEVVIPEEGKLLVTNAIATAYNNQRKFQIDSQDNLHLVFSDNNRVHYAISEDGGTSWENRYIIGYGNHPALGLDTQNKPAICWMERDPLLVGGLDTLWYYHPDLSSPFKLYKRTTGGYISTSVIAVDDNDTTHVVLRVIHPDSGQWKYEVGYRTFHANAPTGGSNWDEDWEKICSWACSDTHWTLSPSIDIDENQKPNVTYVLPSGTAWSHEIYYANKNSGSWESECKGAGSHPFIDMHGNNIDIVVLALRCGYKLTCQSLLFFHKIIA